MKKIKYMVLIFSLVFFFSLSHTNNVAAVVGQSPEVKFSRNASAPMLVDHDFTYDKGYTVNIEKNIDEDIYINIKK